MKKIKFGIIVITGLAAFISFGKSYSLDLRNPVKNGARTRLLAAAPSKDSDGVLRSFSLDAGAADIGEIVTGDELIFTLFDDVTITLTLGKQMPSPLGGDVFLAEASGYEGVKNAVVLRTEDGLTIDVQDYLNDKVYKVISTPAGVVVKEIQPSHDVDCGCDTLDPPEIKGGCRMPSLDSLAIPRDQIDEITNTYHPLSRQYVGGEAPVSEYAYASSQMSYSPHTLLSSSSSESGTSVDILVAYDKGASRWVEDNGGVTNFAIIAVSRMNTALVNTELDKLFRFRLVGIICVDAMTASLDAALKSATYGYEGWESIKAKRDEVGADIVSVMIDTGSESGMTGLGWALKTTAFASFSESAYNACAIRSVAQTSAMLHECGHNMGAGHSDVQKTDIGPQLYDYSSGYYFTAGGTAYSTIMAYGHENPSGATTTDAPYFSSPDYALDGVAVGDDNHDNNRTICQTYAAVAAFRTSKVDEITSEIEDQEELTWLTTKAEVMAKAKSEGKKVFLIKGRNTCGNTVGTRDYSCENALVKPHLLRDYICWFNDYDTQGSESYKYFANKNLGGTLPEVAIIDPESDTELDVAGGYQNVNALRLMLGRVAQEVFADPQSETLFDEELAISLTSALDGVEIHYTLDGTFPTATSPLYTKPIRINATTTLHASIVKDGVLGLPIEAIYGRGLTVSHGGYTWTAQVVSGGCEIIAVEPNPYGDIDIPVNILGHTVVSIKGELFSENSAITSVVIPDGVTKIEDYAFLNCSSLTNAVIGAGVKIIGSQAFMNSRLKSVVIPDGVETIKSSAFSGYSLEEVTIPPSVTYFGFCAFICDYLERVNISDIAAWCSAYFDRPQSNPLCQGSNCQLYLNGVCVTDLTIPSTVKSISAYAFCGCDSIASVLVPPSVTKIGSGAFSSSVSLSKVYLPTSLKDYADEFSPMVNVCLYDGQPGIVRYLPNGGVGSMEDMMFAKNTPWNLRPNSFDRFGYAFAGWAKSPDGEIVYSDRATVSLEQDTVLYAQWHSAVIVTFNANGGTGFMPKLPVSKGVSCRLSENRFTRAGYSFDGWALSPDGEVVYTDLSNVVFTEDKTLYAVWGQSVSYTIKNGVLFSVELNGNTEAVIPQGVISIADSVFIFCRNLTSVVLPDGLVSIGESAFKGCWKLSNLSLPDSLKTVGSYAFADCSLKRFDVNSLESWLGIDFGYEALNYRSIRKLYIDGELLSGLVIVPEGVTKLSGYNFDNFIDITAVDFPESLRTIGMYAFAGCSELRDVSISDGVTSLGAFLFANCDKLKIVDIPSSVTRISSETFCECESLERVIFYGNAPYVDSVNASVFSHDSQKFVAYVPAGASGWDEDGDGMWQNVTLSYYDKFVSVSFNSNGGKGSVRDQLMSVGLDFQHTLQRNRFSRPGYAFAGWATAPDGDVVYADGASVDFDSDTTLYAVWRQALTISFDANGGCDLMHPQYVPEGIGCELKWNKFSFPDRRFAGWATEPNGDIVYSDGETVEFYEDVVLYAVWDDNVVWTILDNGVLKSVTLNGNTEVCVPNSVTSIGMFAFSAARNDLKSVVIPNSVTNIGIIAFQNCINLTSVVIPDSVTSIGSGAFSCCSSLTNVTIPHSVTNLNNDTFSSCISLTSMTIPDSVITIDGSSLFHGCVNLKRVEISAGVSKIPYSTFGGCESLQEIIFRGNAPSVDNSYGGAFNGVPMTCVVYVPQGSYGWDNDGDGKWQGFSLAYYSGIAKVAFDSNGGEGAMLDQNVYISDKFKPALDKNKFVRIGYKFVGWSERPEGDVSYGDCANAEFDVDTTLYAVWRPAVKVSFNPNSGTGYMDELLLEKGVETSAKLPYGTFTKVGHSFDGWATEPEGEVVYADGATIAITEDITLYAVWGDGIIWTISEDGVLQSVNLNGHMTAEIPNSVTCIGSFAFNGCSGLTSVIIPDSVTSIEEFAFEGCSSLDSVIIPDSVTSIGFFAFEGCSSLVSVTVPDSVINFGINSVFGFDSSIASVIVSSNVTSVNNFAFEGNPLLRSIIFMGDAPQTNEASFYGVSSECTVYVRKMSIGWGVEIPGTWQGLHIEYLPEATAPIIESDEGAVIEGDATNGYILKPSEGKKDVVVTIPDEVEPEKVTVEVSATVETVKANGAKVKVMNEGHDIAAFLDLAAVTSSDGVINVANAQVRQAIADETLDVASGADIDLSPSEPSITTANTRPGLKYVFAEGRTIEELAPTEQCKWGDNTPFKPTPSIKGGTSGFYTIKVEK